MTFELVRLIFLGGRLATSQSTGSTRSNKTDLTTVRRISSDCGGLTDVLMVTTTVWMLDWVHRNTTHLRPVVSLHLVLVVRTTRLQHRLVHTTAAGDQTDHCTVTRADDLLRAGWQLDSSSVRVGVVGDHGGAVAGGSGQLATVAELLFDVADGRTLRQATDRQDVADLQAGSLAARDRLTGVHSFGGDEQLLSQAIFIWITEGDDRQRCSSTRIVDDLLNDSFEKTISFGEVERSQFRGAFASSVM